MRKALSILYLTVLGLSCVLWVISIVGGDSFPVWLNYIPIGGLCLLPILGIVLSILSLAQKKQETVSLLCLIANILVIAALPLGICPLFLIVPIIFGVIGVILGITLTILIFFIEKEPINKKAVLIGMGVILFLPIAGIGWGIVNDIREEKAAMAKAKREKEAAELTHRRESAQMDTLYMSKRWRDILAYKTTTETDSNQQRIIQEADSVLTDSLTVLLKTGKYEKAIELADFLEGVGFLRESILDPYSKGLAQAYYTLAQKAFKNEEWVRASEYMDRACKYAPGNSAYAKFQKRCLLYKEASPEIRSAMAKKRHLVIGMSEEQVIESMGRPREINRTVSDYCVREQWVYGDFGPYLYFDDGVLTSWQD